MTVATLLLTCLVFLLLGWTAADPYFVTALSVGGIVCIAASNGGTTSQDLKTGFWVGGTPWKQQIAILIGATVSALLLGPILIQLNESSTVYQRVEPTAFSQQFQVPEQQLLREGGQLKGERSATRILTTRRHIASGTIRWENRTRRALFDLICRADRLIWLTPVSTAWSRNAPTALTLPNTTRRKRL
jgi:hypothetical protein